MTKLVLRADNGQATPPPAMPAPGERVIVAIDISRTKWVYCVRWGGQERRRLSTPPEVGHVARLIAAYQDHPVQLVYEACGFGYELAWWAQAHGLAVVVVAPSTLERAPGRRVKTDVIDAGVLARKAERGELKGIAVPTRAVHEQRQLVRTYEQAVHDRQRAQVRVRSLLQEHGRLGPSASAGWSAYQQWLSAQALPAPVQACVEELLALRAAAHASAQRLHTRLLALAKRPEYQPLVAALTTQAGVGAFTALRLVLEIGRLDRFASAQAFVHYLGLTPSEYSSGPLTQRGAILKCGPGALRASLVQCAWVTQQPKRGDPHFQRLFQQLAPRMGKKRAIIAVTRRLARRLYARWHAALPPAAAAL